MTQRGMVVSLEVTFHPTLLLPGLIGFLDGLLIALAIGTQSL